jgi:hypothetical protein
LVNGHSTGGEFTKQILYTGKEVKITVERQYV